MHIVYLIGGFPYLKYSSVLIVFGCIYRALYPIDEIYSNQGEYYIVI